MENEQTLFKKCDLSIQCDSHPHSNSFLRRNRETNPKIYIELGKHAEELVMLGKRKTKGETPAKLARSRMAERILGN